MDMEIAIPTKFLWCGTLAAPSDTALDRYYGTYAIDDDSRLHGMMTPPHHRHYTFYKVLDEFSSIAIQLIGLGVFTITPWADALQAALQSVAESPAGPIGD